MAAVAEAVIRVLADVSPLIREMSRGADSMGAFGRASKNVADRLDSFGAKAIGAGKKMSIASAAIAAAAGAVLLFAKGMAESGDEMAKNARSAGVSTDYYQEMAFAIGQVTNATEEEFAKSLELLNRKLGEAQQGSKGAIAAFESIGISQADIASGSVNTEKAFDMMIAKFDEVEDPALRAAIAASLLGRQGAALGGQLGGASAEIKNLRQRAQDLGFVLSKEASKAAEDFGDKWAELGKGFEGLKVKIANELLPVFVNVLIPAIIDKVIPALGRLAEIVGNAIEWFAALAPSVQAAAGYIAAAFAAAGPALLAIGGFSRAISVLIAATGPIGLFILAATALYVAWQKWGDDIKAAVGGAIDYISTKIDAIIKKFEEWYNAVVEVKNKIAEVLSFGGDVPAQFNASGAGMGGAMDEFSGGMFAGDQGGGGGAYGVGVGIAAGISQGIGDTLPQAIEHHMQTIPNLAKEVLEIHSPSRVMASIGQQIGAGLAQGITEAQGLVQAAMETTGAAAVAGTQGMVSGVMSSLGQLFEGSKKFAVAQALVNAWTGMTEALKLPFPQNLIAAGKVLATGLNAVKNIKSARPGSGGSGGAAAGGGGAGGGAAAAPSAYYTVNMPSEGQVGAKSVRNLIGMINKEIEGGAVLRGIRTI